MSAMGDYLPIPKKKKKKKLQHYQHNEILLYTQLNGKTPNIKYWRGFGESRTLLHYWQECKMV